MRWITCDEVPKDGKELRTACRHRLKCIDIWSYHTILFKPGEGWYIVGYGSPKPDRQVTHWLDHDQPNSLDQ
jgi:hypothetical protein